MAKRASAKAVDSEDRNALRPEAATTLNVQAEPGEHHLKTLARISLAPGVRHANLANAFSAGTFGDKHKPSIMDSTEVIAAYLAKAESGDKELASRMLTAQAISLDTIFAELSRRSAMNMGDYLNAADRYMRLALKAQTACRTTLEALAKIHQPREQTVKHVHVNEGGQAVVADQFHNHRGAAENAESNEQCHATGAAGSGPAMLGQDSEGNGVPIASCEGAKAMPDARRDQSGRA